MVDETHEKFVANMLKSANTKKSDSKNLMVGDADHKEVENICQEIQDRLIGKYPDAKKRR